MSISSRAIAKCIAVYHRFFLVIEDLALGENKRIILSVIKSLGQYAVMNIILSIIIQLSVVFQAFVVLNPLPTICLRLKQ